jgi:hypothetical protein
VDEIPQPFFDDHDRKDNALAGSGNRPACPGLALVPHLQATRSNKEAKEKLVFSELKQYVISNEDGNKDPAVRFHLQSRFGFI